MPNCCEGRSIAFGILTVVGIVLIIVWGLYAPNSPYLNGNYGYNYYNRNYNYYYHRPFPSKSAYCDRDWDLTCKVAEANPSPATYNDVNDTISAVPGVATNCACLTATSTYYLSHKVLARTHLGCISDGDFRASFTFDKHVVEPSKYRSVAGPPGNTTSAAAGFTLSEPWAIRWLSRWAEGAFPSRKGHYEAQSSKAATPSKAVAPRVSPGWDVQYAPTCFVSEACGAAVWKGLSGGDASGYPTEALKTRPYDKTSSRAWNDKNPCTWFVVGTTARDTCDKDLVAMKKAGFHLNYLSSNSDSAFAGDARLMSGVWSRLCTKLSHCTFAAVDVSHTGFETNCKVKPIPAASPKIGYTNPGYGF